MEQRFRALKVLGAATMLVVAAAAPFTAPWPYPLTPQPYSGTEPFFTPAEVLVRDPKLVGEMQKAANAQDANALQLLVENVIRLDARELEYIAPPETRISRGETLEQARARYAAARYAFEVGDTLNAILMMPDGFDGKGGHVEHLLRGQAEFDCLSSNRRHGPDDGRTAYRCRDLHASGNAEVRQLAAAAPAIIHALRTEAYYAAAAQVAFVWIVLLASLIAYLLRERIFTWLAGRTAAAAE